MTPANPAISERWLLQRYRRDGDRVARERLVALMMPLVHSVVSRYHHPRYEDDLVQAAALGLTKAIERYDPARGVELRTYAIPTMHGEVRRWLRDNAWAVHMPRPLQERVLLVTATIDELGRRFGCSPSPQDVAAELRLAVEDVLEAMQAGRAFTSTSLEVPLGEEEGATMLAEVLGEDDPRLERAERIAMLSRARGVLDERQREVLRLRFIDDLTQSQIAVRIGCSQMQVSRILRQALDRLGEAVQRPPRLRPRVPLVA
jgi:RNA polymerase sigma-B factor